MAAIVGCLLAGVPAVPVPPDSGPAERDHIVTDSGVALLLAGAANGVVIRRDAIAADLDALAAAWDWSPDDLLGHGLPLYHVHQARSSACLGAGRAGCSPDRPRQVALPPRPATA